MILLAIAAAPLLWMPLLYLRSRSLPTLAQEEARLRGQLLDLRAALEADRTPNIFPREWS